MREKFKPTPLHTALETLSILMLLFLFGFLAVRWHSLPARIPSHFNGSGAADAWGGKGTLFILPAVSLVFYILLTVGSCFPSVWNFPVQITEENRERLYGVVRNMISALKLVLIALFTYITVCSATSEPLGSLFLPITLVAVFGTVAVSLALVIKASGPRA